MKNMLTGGWVTPFRAPLLLVVFALLTSTGIALFLAGKEFARMESALEQARVHIQVHRVDEASVLLETQAGRREFRWLSKLYLVNDEEFLRFYCVVALKRKDYEKAVEVCTAALVKVRAENVKHELYFNRAVAHIHLLGGPGRSHELARNDLGKLLRTDYHARAAELLEKLNLFPKQAGDGSENEMPGDMNGLSKLPGGAGGGTNSGF